MRTCPRCQTRTGGGATLCRNCGGPLPPLDAEQPPVDAPIEFVPPSVGLRTCARCGACVPAKHPHCTRCGRDAETRVVPPRPDGAYWARVGCDYSCAVCKAYWPLATFDAEGRAVGTVCGHAQEFPIFFWRAVLSHAHAVADLAGPDPEGRGRTEGESVGPINPFKEVGLSSSFAPGDAMKDDVDVPRELRAGPGVPLCAGCQRPVDAAWCGGELVCGACGHRAHGVLPKTASKVNRSLVTVLGGAPSFAHRLEQGRGIVALRCPTCSGPLTLAEGASLASCSFCNTTSLVARPTAPAAPPATELVFWLLFRGPSAKRKSLVERPR